VRDVERPRHSGTSTANEKLAVELAAGKTIRDSSAAAGISEATAYRRLADQPSAPCVGTPAVRSSSLIS
jgi:hypothetical protein